VRSVSPSPSGDARSDCVVSSAEPRGLSSYATRGSETLQYASSRLCDTCPSASAVCSAHPPLDIARITHGEISVAVRAVSGSCSEYDPRCVPPCASTR
jgi:hypothetical protein